MTASPAEIARIGSIAVSVIVPVRNAGSDIPELIRCLDAQTVPRTSFEILIADDGSTDGSIDGLDGEGVIVLPGPPRNAYAARNRALARARGDVIAFCDADCRPEPTWLDEGLNALRDADLVAGHIRFFVPPARSVWTIIDIDTTKDHERQVRAGNAETANLFVRASVFREVGLFDDRQPGYGDFEFAQRAVASGKRLVFSPRAVVAHPTRNSGGSFLRNHWLMHRSYAEFEARSGRLPDGLKLRSWVPVVQTVRGRRRAGRSLRADRSVLDTNDIRPTLREDLVALPLMYLLLPYVGCAGQLAGWLSVRRNGDTGGGPSVLATGASTAARASNGGRRDA